MKEKICNNNLNENRKLIHKFGQNSQPGPEISLIQNQK